MKKTTIFEKHGLQSKSTEFLKHVCTDSREKKVHRFYYDIVALRLYVTNHYAFSVDNKDISCKAGIMHTDLVQLIICLEAAYSAKVTNVSHKVNIK